MGEGGGGLGKGEEAWGGAKVFLNDLEVPEHTQGGPAA